MKTLIKPSELNKRFVIIAILLLTVFALIGLIAGCGNDNNPTGNNNPPVVNNDSLLFSIDSFTIKSNDPSRIATFSYFDTVSTARKYKVVYNVVSNIPASNDTAFCDYASITSPGTPNFTQILKRNEQTNNLAINITYTVSDTLGSYNTIRHYFDVGFKNSYPNTAGRYITVKKFQLFLLD